MKAGKLLYQRTDEVWQYIITLGRSSSLLKHDASQSMGCSSAIWVCAFAFQSQGKCFGKYRDNLLNLWFLDVSETLSRLKMLFSSCIFSSYLKQRVLALTWCRISLLGPWAITDASAWQAHLCIALDIFSFSMWKIFMPCLILSGAHHSATNMHDDLEPLLECTVCPATCIPIPLWSAGVSKALFVPSSVTDKVVKHNRSPGTDSCGTPPVAGIQGITINQLICPRLVFQTVISYLTCKNALMRAYLQFCLHL